MVALSVPIHALPHHRYQWTWDKDRSHAKTQEHAREWSWNKPSADTRIQSGCQSVGPEGGEVYICHRENKNCELIAYFE